MTKERTEGGWNEASVRYRRRRLHRTPPGHLPEGARALGPRRRPQAPRVHRRGRRRVRVARPAPVGRRVAGDARRRRGYALAADMGGMGFISAHHAEILHNNSLINLHTLEAAAGSTASSATSTPRRPASTPSTCRPRPTSVPLKEEDAYPAEPQDAYGWEKLVTEQLCKYYTDDYPMETRIVRFHNIYGPLRHLRRRPREGAGGDVPQGRARPRTAAIDRDLGRRRADPLVLLHRRLRRGHLPPDALRLPPSRSTSAPTGWCPINELADSSPKSPASATSA